MAHSSAPGRSSRLTDSDKEWSCSCLTVAGPRCTRVWHSASNDVCGMRPWMKPCGQQQQEKQQVDNLCPCPKCVPGHPNLSHPGAPLYAAVSPSRPLLHPGRPKYSTAWPAVQPLAENSPKSCLQHYLAWHGQDLLVQMKPHSQPHAISAKDLKPFAISQVLLDVLCQN